MHYPWNISTRKSLKVKVDSQLSLKLRAEKEKLQNWRLWLSESQNYTTKNERDLLNTYVLQILISTSKTVITEVTKIA